MKSTRRQTLIAAALVGALTFTTTIARAEYTQGGSGARLMVLVHHDDAVREFAYGAESHIGTFSDALMAEAKKNSWTVISMKNDWKTIFAFEKN